MAAKLRGLLCHVDSRRYKGKNSRFAAGGVGRSPAPCVTMFRNAKTLTWCSAILVTFGGASRALAQPKTEWVLQQHFDNRGDAAIYLSPDAVKVVSLDWGYEVVAKAPTWVVHCYRPKERIEWTSELARFNGVMLEDPVHTGGANVHHIVPTGQGVMQGLHYTSYSFTQEPRSKLIATGDIALSAKAMDFICRYSDSPNSGGVPLYRSRFRDKGAAQSRINAKDGWLAKVDYMDDKRRGTIVDLATKSWKKQPFDASHYAYPHDFKAVNPLSLVTYSSSQKQTLNEVFGDMGFPSDQSAEKKPKSSSPVR